MNWLDRVQAASDAASQWMVEAPIAVQMLVLVCTVVPVAVCVAWALMFVIDAVARRLPGAEMGNAAARAKIVHHVEPH